MPFWQQWALLEGLNEYNEALREDSGEASEGYDSDEYDPRFPSASRGDVMAEPEELMAFGMQYSRE